MLGAIIGDTVGSIYEFDNIKTTDFPFFSERSEFTDDSVMSVAVADWLLQDKNHTHKELEDSMVHFANQYRNPIGGYGGSFYRWLFSGRERVPYNSWGNGSAMRVSAAARISRVPSASPSRSAATATPSPVSPGASPKLTTKKSPKRSPARCGPVCQMTSARSCGRWIGPGGIRWWGVWNCNFFMGQGGERKKL